MSEEDEPQAPAYLGWTLLAAAAVTVAFLGYITWRILAATGPVCNHVFPPRESRLPSWAFVFAAIAAFALGHLSGQLAVRREHRPQTDLGQGRWSNQRAVVAVHAAVAVFLLVVTVLMVIEAWTLGHRHWPITYYTRCATDAGPWLALLGSAVYAFIVGRWLWVFRG